MKFRHLRYRILALESLEYRRVLSASSPVHLGSDLSEMSEPATHVAYSAQLSDGGLMLSGEVDITKSGPGRRVGTALSAVHAEYRAHADRNGPVGFEPTNPLLQV